MFSGNVLKSLYSEIPSLVNLDTICLRRKLTVISDEQQDVHCKTSFSTPAMRTLIYRKIFLMNRKGKNQTRKATGVKVSIKYLFNAFVTTFRSFGSLLSTFFYYTDHCYLPLKGHCKVTFFFFFRIIKS